MIRFILYSPDIKLQSLLASALKPEYEVVLESKRENLRQVIRESGADILALDFDSNHSSLEQQLEFYNDLGERNFTCKGCRPSSASHAAVRSTSI